MVKIAFLLGVLPLLLAAHCVGPAEPKRHNILIGGPQNSIVAIQAHLEESGKSGTARRWDAQYVRFDANGDEITANAIAGFNSAGALAPDPAVVATNYIAGYMTDGVLVHPMAAGHVVRWVDGTLDAVVAIGDSGQQLWTQSFPEASCSAAWYDLATSPDGQWIVAGRLCANNIDILTFDPAGQARRPPVAVEVDSATSVQLAIQDSGDTLVQYFSSKPAAAAPSTNSFEIDSNSIPRQLDSVDSIFTIDIVALPDRWAFLTRDVPVSDDGASLQIVDRALKNIYYKKISTEQMAVAIAATPDGTVTVAYGFEGNFLSIRRHDRDGDIVSSNYIDVNDSLRSDED